MKKNTTRMGGMRRKGQRFSVQAVGAVGSVREQARGRRRVSGDGGVRLWSATVVRCQRFPVQAVGAVGSVREQARGMAFASGSLRQAVPLCRKNPPLGFLGID
ncbi:hypothetical protein L2E82_12548 [Cichorium intybus]|uniref:Uncharacterized protein n=1 Tax=Cichorium intybus TaxID=13427 RepID=A0ACB9GHE8_CICIN|nr:hypothetical protein L2E82_12548 [Cichorium intybus]